MMVMQDYPDSTGSAIVSKGDHLSADNVGKLADAGIKQYQPARSPTWISMFL